MSEAAGPPSLPSSQGGTTRPRSPLWADARRRAVELLIVFVGVYAAFLLNRMDNDRRDAKRRAQILDAVERELSSGMAGFKQNVALGEANFAAFDRQLARGDMPKLSIVYTNSSYNASDDAVLLQAGGLELLDMQTVELLRKVNETQREMLEGAHNQFQLSLAELTNHRNPEDFYDPVTRRLKPEYQWYPYILHDMLTNARAALAAEEALLAHLRAKEGHGAATAATPVPSPADRTTPSRTPPVSTP